MALDGIKAHCTRFKRIPGTGLRCAHYTAGPGIPVTPKGICRHPISIVGKVHRKNCGKRPSRQRKPTRRHRRNRK